MLCFSDKLLLVDYQKGVINLPNQSATNNVYIYSIYDRSVYMYKYKWANALVPPTPILRPWLSDVILDVSIFVICPKVIF